MIKKCSENTVLPESLTEYEVACRDQALDVLLASASHLFFYVTKGGAIHTMTGLSKDFNILQQDEVYEKNPILAAGKLRRENGTWRYSSSQARQGLSIDAMIPWLWGDFKEFLSSSAEKADMVKTVNVPGGNVEYRIGLSRVFSADSGTDGAIISVMAQSEIGRSAREHQRLEVLSETFREVRMFCHDFSQPLMVLSGYMELINSAPPGNKNCFRGSHMEGLEREIHKLGSIYQKLRDAIIHCRKKIDLTDTPPET